ncbi:MAG: PspC domain-containing protein [Acidimicrobiia bacterium]
MATSTESIRDESQLETQVQKRLFRSQSKKVVGGVCGGLGDYFAVDPVWFRVGFVVLALGGGSGILIYLLMWLIVEPEPVGYTPPTEVRAPLKPVAIVGVVFMVVGTIALVNTVAPALGQYVWPLILLMGGLVLVIGGLNRDSH